MSNSSPTGWHPTHLLDVLRDTEHWLHWTRFFGPISGHEAKLDDPRPALPRHHLLLWLPARPGTNGARRWATSTGGNCPGSTGGTSPKRAWTKRFGRSSTPTTASPCPNAGERASSASVDGTKWDLYEQNLLSEYHIRYGGYGGIGYYHVSDTYIALFSHFIPCGVWEAVYLLDGLLKNLSDIQPDTIHGDTQAQSTPVFGLAALLGIALMPRIRNWKDLKLYRPDTANHLHPHRRPVLRYDRLAADPDPFARHAAGRALDQGRAGSPPRRCCASWAPTAERTGSTRPFGSWDVPSAPSSCSSTSASAELRALIQAATNKSESFNGFTQWVAFGGDGTITTNDRDEQRKLIKYNHLVANCVIFHNVFSLSRVLHDLQREGYPLEARAWWPRSVPT